MKSLYKPQPLLNRGQLFQIRAESTFDRLKACNRALQVAEEDRDAVYARFLAHLPQGYQSLPYGPATDGLFYVVDGAGGDVGYPLTQFEVHGRAWAHFGGQQPLLADWPDWVAAERLVEGLRQERKAISDELARIDRTTVLPAWAAA